MRAGLPPPDESASLPTTPAGRGLWFLDRLAGLFAGGMLVIGSLLLLAAVTAPAALSAAGLGSADGPGWDRVGAHLIVGAGGEVVIRLRKHWAHSVRLLADLGVIVAAVVVISWAWWP